MAKFWAVRWLPFTLWLAEANRYFVTCIQGGTSMRIAFAGNPNSGKTTMYNALTPLEQGMATHSSIPAWRIPRTEEPGRQWPWVCKESDTIEWLTLPLQWLRLWFHCRGTVSIPGGELRSHMPLKKKKKVEQYQTPIFFLSLQNADYQVLHEFVCNFLLFVVHAQVHLYCISVDQF